MSTMPGWTLAATALTSMSGALPDGDGRKGRGLNRPPRAGPVSVLGAGAALRVGRDRWMSIRSMNAHAAVTMDRTRATTSAAVSRLGPVRTGAGTGGAGGGGAARAGALHGAGTLPPGRAPG